MLTGRAVFAGKNAVDRFDRAHRLLGSLNHQVNHRIQGRSSPIQTIEFPKRYTERFETVIRNAMPVVLTAMTARVRAMGLFPSKEARVDGSDSSTIARSLSYHFSIFYVDMRLFSLSRISTGSRPQQLHFYQFHKRPPDTSATKHPACGNVRMRVPWSFPRASIGDFSRG
jgi:hypothetical protein